MAEIYRTISFLIVLSFINNFVLSVRIGFGSCPKVEELELDRINIDDLKGKWYEQKFLTNFPKMKSFTKCAKTNIEIENSSKPVVVKMKNSVTISLGFKYEFPVEGSGDFSSKYNRVNMTWKVPVLGLRSAPLYILTIGEDYAFIWGCETYWKGLINLQSAALITRNLKSLKELDDCLSDVFKEINIKFLTPEMFDTTDHTNCKHEQ